MHLAVWDRTQRSVSHREYEPCGRDPEIDCGFELAPETWKLCAACGAPNRLVQRECPVCCASFLLNPANRVNDSKKRSDIEDPQATLGRETLEKVRGKFSNWACGETETKKKTRRVTTELDDDKCPGPSGALLQDRPAC